MIIIIHQLTARFWYQNLAVSWWISANQVFQRINCAFHRSRHKIKAYVKQQRSGSILSSRHTSPWTIPTGDWQQKKHRASRKLYYSNITNKWFIFVTYNMKFQANNTNQFWTFTQPPFSRKYPQNQLFFSIYRTNYMFQPYSTSDAATTMHKSLVNINFQIFIYLSKLFYNKH